MKNCKVLLFEGFETLDVFGPVEILAHIKDITVELCSLAGGLVSSTQNYEVNTTKFIDSPIDILLIPGGQGTRKLVEDTVFLHKFEKILQLSSIILSVCTGAALLAKTTYLNDTKATTNKRAFEWVTSLNPEVNWQKSARWVNSGHIYTSSGISAGIDMTLGFVADYYNLELAEEIANRIEYTWSKDAGNDPFAVE